MSEGDGLVWALQVDDQGRGHPIGWNDLPADGGGAFRWIHLDLEAPRAQEWLREQSGLSELEAEALLAESTRPRATPMGDALLLILRGVNLTAGANPEDMISVRVWIDAERVITVRRLRLLAAEDVRDLLLAGSGPTNVGEFVVELADHLVERMDGVIGDLSDGLDEVEEHDGEASSDRRGRLADLRRQAIALRRHLSPQRDALARVATERSNWIGESERIQLREILDRTTRYVEDLEAARERAAVAQEELASRLAEQLNQRMYALSVIAGVFLPLSFVTGLLGINVAGIPGTENGWAFIAVCGSLVALAVGEIVLFRRLRWL